MKAFFRELWSLTAPYWRSKEKWRALLLLGTIIGITLGQVYLNVQFNKWRNGFYDALQNYDRDAFFHAIYKFSFLATCFIILAVYGQYLYQMLTIKWRRWLTDYYLERWVAGNVYYRLQVEGNPADNPDQRISEDIKQFVEYTLNLSLGLLKNIVNFFSFLFILWELSGPLKFSIGAIPVVIPNYLVWVALVYAVVGTGLTKKIGNPLIGLNFNQQRMEADFRYSMIRLRENAESVSFYRGEKLEREIFTDRFTRLFDNFWQIMLRQKKLTWFTAGYGQIAEVFPYLVVAPRYFAKTIKLGDLMQTAGAFGEVQGSLSYIIDHYVNIAQWRAVVDRLTSFNQSMEYFRAEASSPANFRTTSVNDNSLSIENVSLLLPDASLLQKDISFRLGPGESLLIQGPSGCGKSTLLRTVAGIWPFAEGKVGVPSGARALFVPQRPYLPLGTLRRAIIYPADGVVPDEIFLPLMKKCQLGRFIPMLDEIQPWGQVLSLGEQQRIAFLRALLLKQDLIFLDEASSALDEENEAYFYDMLRKELPDAVIVSVGHRGTLKKWHDRVIVLKAEGKAQSA